MLSLESIFHNSGVVNQLRVLVEMSTSNRPPSAGASPDSTPSTTQLPDPPQMMRRRKRRVRAPAKNSLVDIMQQHAGTSLFVRPICWTDLHAKLLGVRFQELPSCDTPFPTNIPGSPPSKGHMRPSHTIKVLSNALTDLLTPTTPHPVLSSGAVKTIMQTIWPEVFSKAKLLPELHLYFGGRVQRDAVRAQVLWNFPSDAATTLSSFKSVSTRPADSFNTSVCHSPANLPMLCYMGRSQLSAIRKNLFRVISGPGKSWNAPVQRLQQLRAKTLFPENADHDVHFLGIMLAMAQRHFYKLPAPASQRLSQWSLPANSQQTRPDFQDVKMRILSHDDDTADFIVYTGHLSAGFLERFHDPRKVVAFDEDGNVPGVKIEYTRVPIWPILGLRERLGKALGPELVGDVDLDQVETWEEDAAAEESEGGKRKREPLAEVVNASFDSESEDEPILNEKKRRLGEGCPIGVVV